MPRKPNETKAERSARNKADKAVLVETRAAGRAAREAERAERAERARAAAAARATEMVPLDRVPQTAKELQRMCKQLTPWALSQLVEIAGNPHASDRVSASNSIIDRAFGKSVQQVHITGGVFDDVDDDELEKYIAENAPK